MPYVKQEVRKEELRMIELIKEYTEAIAIVKTKLTSEQLYELLFHSQAVPIEVLTILLRDCNTENYADTLKRVKEINQCLI